LKGEGRGLEPCESNAKRSGNAEFNFLFFFRNISFMKENEESDGILKNISFEDG